VSCS